MSDVMGNVKEALDLSFQAFKLLEKAGSITSHGPSSFYMEKLKCYVSALFSFAPAQVGDAVEMLEVPYTRGTAWEEYEKTIFKPGSRAVVREIDWDAEDAQFVFGVVFDREWFICKERDGRERTFEVEPENRHMFSLLQKYVRRVVPKAEVKA